MNKTLKLFSLLFIFSFAAVFADSKVDLENYRLYVTEIDPEFHSFRLSNNIICTVCKRNGVPETLPEVGTEVYIQTAQIVVSNPQPECERVFGYAQDRAKKSFLAWITPESKQYGLSCVSSHQICIAPAGWIMPAQYRDVILLSDGSQWVKDDGGKTVFGPESHVVVSQQSEDGYSIIDLDPTDDIYTRTYNGIMKINFARFEKVKPYFPEN